MKLLVFNQKGGVGKSTLSVQIAYHLFATGHEVELIDTDPQGTSAVWYEDCEIQPICNFSVKHTPNMLTDQNMRRVGWTIIDGCMTSINAMIAAIKAVDLVLIPVTPSQLDLDATLVVEQLIIERQQMDDRVRAAYVINNAGNNSATRSLKDALCERSTEYHTENPTFTRFKVLQTIVHRRLVHAKTVGRGATVWQAITSGKDRDCDPLAKTSAIGEMEALVKEIKEWGAGA